MIHACFIIVYAQLLCRCALVGVVSVSVPRARAVLRRFCVRELVSGAPPRQCICVSTYCAAGGCLACCGWCAARLGSCEQAQAEHDQRESRGREACVRRIRRAARAGAVPLVQGAVWQAVGCAEC
jgi:hypothetical protein